MPRIYSLLRYMLRQDVREIQNLQIHELVLLEASKQPSLTTFVKFGNAFVIYFIFPAQCATTHQIRNCG